jgi:hypothetical protein
MYSNQEEKINKKENPSCIESNRVVYYWHGINSMQRGDLMAVIKVNFGKLAEIQGEQSNMAFMEGIGMDGSYLYRIKKGETEVGKDFVANVLSKYRLKFEEVFYLAEASRGNKAKREAKAN